MTFRIRVREERVSDSHITLISVITAKHNKVTGRTAPDIVPFPFVAGLPRTSVKIGGTEPGEDRNASFQIFPDQGRGKVLETQFAD